MESPERMNQRSFGRHEAWTTTNDTVYVLWRGDVLGGDIDVVDSIIHSLPSDCPNLALVQDVSNVDKFTSEARAKIIAHKDSQKLTLVVLVGASFHVRMIQMMINRAMRLLHTTTGLMQCCDTMEQAHERIDENRRQLRAVSPTSKT
jgi:hypothetical protein